MSRSRAVDENQVILKELLEKRYELAKLLGHDNFAVTNMLGTMVKKSSNVVEFIDKLLC